MREQIEPAELSVDAPQRVPRIGQLLQEASYTEDSMTRLAEGSDARELRPETVGLVWARSRDGTALSTFARLFMLGLPVSREQVAAAVAPMGLQEWLEAGLLVSVGERLAASVRIEPFRGRLVASDPPSMLGHPDIVLGRANASRMLLNATVRRPVERALDLGCGSGVQALEAAAHADHVVAVDINPRAVMMTRFNAQLNSLENVEVRQGSLFEPVAGERFGLIVANPPFVISPDQSFRYRDGGMDGDGLVRFLAEHAGEFLEEGGFFEMVCDWATVRG